MAVKDAAQVLNDAMLLPPEERAALAGSLLDSLDPEVDEDVEDAWRQEIERRVAQLDSGEAKLVPWESVRVAIRARIGG